MKPKYQIARETRKISTKSPALIGLHSLWTKVKEDYENPLRSEICALYNDELDRCGRYYFDDGVERYAVIHGGAFLGEESMLSSNNTLSESEFNAELNTR